MAKDNGGVYAVGDHRRQDVVGLHCTHHTQTLSIVSWIVFSEHKAEYINSCPLFMHRSTILCIPGSIRSQGRKPRFLLEAGSIFSSFASSRTKLQIHQKSKLIQLYYFLMCYSADIMILISSWRLVYISLADSNELLCNCIYQRHNYKWFYIFSQTYLQIVCWGSPAPTVNALLVSPHK